MEAHPVDPRDIRWEVPVPHFRVTFWSKPPHTSYEFDLADCDVRQALAWADENAGDRTFTIGAVVPAPDGPGLVHLFGVDPSVPV